MSFWHWFTFNPGYGTWLAVDVYIYDQNGIYFNNKVFYSQEYEYLWCNLVHLTVGGATFVAAYAKYIDWYITNTLVQYVLDPLHPIISTFKINRQIPISYIYLRERYISFQTTNYFVYCLCYLNNHIQFGRWSFWLFMW